MSIAAGLALSLSACGDDVTEINNNSAIAVLKSGEKLSKQSCDSTNVGEMLFVMDSVTTFVCDGKSWQTMKGETGSDGTSCKAKSVKNKAKTLEGVEVSCDGAVMDTIWNGVDGAKGEPGESAEDGTSCTAVKVSKDGREGVELTCGKVVIDTVWNGVDGAKGDSGAVGAACTAAALGATADHQNGGVKITCGENSYDLWNGDDGESAYELSGSELSEEEWIESLNVAGCTLDDDGKGSVTVTCGTGDDTESTVLYKAVCGTEPYEPAKKFCSEGELYSCNGKPYDPKALYCLELGDGESKTFKLEALLTDSRDGQVYKTVAIGSQVWMAENLNFNSNFLPEGKTAAADSVINSWCRYDDENGAKFGRVYTWAAAIDSAALAVDADNPQTCGYINTAKEVDCDRLKNDELAKAPIQGVCPEGWHLPSYDEWDALRTAVSVSFLAGKMLKSQTGWDNYGDGIDGNGNDAYGFSALPAGYINYAGILYGPGEVTRFWSSSEYSGINAYYMQLNNDNKDVALNYNFKHFAHFVRCLQN